MDYLAMSVQGRYGSSILSPMIPRKLRGRSQKGPRAQLAPNALP